MLGESKKKTRANNGNVFLRDFRINMCVGFFYKYFYGKNKLSLSWTFKRFKKLKNMVALERSLLFLPK